MKWEVTIPDNSKVVVEADNCRIQQDGTLSFLNYLADPKDTRSVYTVIRAYPPGTWTHMEAINFTSSPAPVSAAPRAKSKTVSKFDTARLVGQLDGVVDCTRGEIAHKLQEVLGVKSSMSYRIVRQLMEEGKIRMPKKSKKYDVVDPELNPMIQQILDDMKQTYEDFITRDYK